MSSPCRISEVLQYVCTQEQGGIECIPISRFFRICPGRPAVEITKFVEYNEATGEVNVPADSRLVPVQAKPWRDITRTPLAELDASIGDDH